ncbi:MAG: hypothetical protein ACOYWZ_18550 [Bacillota bacterium]
MYIVLLGITVSKHEPWFDEAQAWLLARDSGLVELLVRYLRYEGSPGLWHLLLMVPAKLGAPYIVLNIISAVFAAAGVYLFLRYSPFPPLIKILYPFSFFAFYQYAVVARSYALLSVLLFSIAVIYKDKIDKPFLFTGLIILLANVSFHGLLIAASLIFIHVTDIIKLWFSIKLSIRYRHIAAILLFGIIIFLIKLQLQPPKDLISVAGFNRDISQVFNKGMGMLVNSLAVNNLAAYNSSTFHNLTNILSKFAIVLTLFWLTLRKNLLVYIVPVSALSILFTTIYSHVWHQGTLFLTWIFSLWISFENLNGSKDKITSISKGLVTLTLAAVLSIQAYWSYSSLSYDYHRSYSASKDVAYYIKANQLENKKIYATNFHSMSIQPYFKSNIFCNYNNRQQPSFWIWSRENSMYREPYLVVSDYDPDIIILGVKNYGPKNEAVDKPYIPDISGYRFSRLFIGALYWKNRILETDSFILYEKSQVPSDS